MPKFDTLSPIQIQIREEIAKAVATLGGKSGIIGIIMSWGDTLDEYEIHQKLLDWNSDNN